MVTVAVIGLGDLNTAATMRNCFEIPGVVISKEGEDTINLYAGSGFQRSHRVSTPSFKRGSTRNTK